MNKAMQKIEARLAKLERQKGYIFGMWLAEYAEEYNFSEKAAIATCEGKNMFTGKDPALIIKGFRAQKNEIQKRKWNEASQERNLFKNL